MLSEVERRELLQDYVRKGEQEGFRRRKVIYDGHGATMSRGGSPKVSRVVHVVLTVLSAGLWIPLYLFLKIRGTENVQLYVDEGGRVTYLDYKGAARAGLYGEDTLVVLNDDAQA